MVDLKITSSFDKPEISFQSNGSLSIQGKSNMENDNFWDPVRSWFANYLENPAPKTTISLHFESLNITASKAVLQMLYQLNELTEKGHTATVEWAFNHGDHDMLEIGKDFEHLVKVPFLFLELAH